MPSSNEGIELVTTNIEAACERILRSLPMWFGQEGAIVEYVADASRLPTFAGIEGEEVGGFLTLRQHSPQSFEISCLAVHALYRGHGLGRALVDFASSWAAARGGQFLQVKTIAAASPSPEYAQTRAFYAQMGFVPLEVFPTLWSARHPCLQLIKHIKHGA
jgi:GNAT superfamily N-acetyltransferase